MGALQVEGAAVVVGIDDVFFVLEVGEEDQIDVGTAVVEEAVEEVASFPRRPGLVHKPNPYHLGMYVQHYSHQSQFHDVDKKYPNPLLYLSLRVTVARGKPVLSAA
jgi:hypothetical protein